MPSCSRTTTDALHDTRGSTPAASCGRRRFRPGTCRRHEVESSRCGAGLRGEAHHPKRLRAMGTLPGLDHLLAVRACPHTHVVRRNEAQVRVARALPRSRPGPEKFAHFGAFWVVQCRKRHSRLRFFSGRDKALKCRIGDRMHRCMHSPQVVRPRQALHAKRIKQGVSAACASRTQSRGVFPVTAAPPCRRRGHRRLRPGARKKVAPGC